MNGGRRSNLYLTLLMLALILVLAGVLRFYRIDAQSFWNDEGNSARLAERSLDLIIEGARGDIHPPGYYVALHYWRAVLGESEAALRALSAACSVAIIGVVFALGRRLFNDAAALLAAALASINPFQVYYAQEARMYAMLALWAAASSWAMVCWIQAAERDRTRRLGPLVAYVLSAVAGLYTHYAFPLVMLAQNLGVALWLWNTWIRRDTVRRAGTWTLTQVAVVMLYLPWLRTAWHQVTSWSPPVDGDVTSAAFSDIWRLLNFGQTIATAAVVGGMIAAAAAILVVLLPIGREAPVIGGMSFRLRRSLVVLLVFVPVGLIVVLGLYRPAYQKFLLVAAAPLSLLVARAAIGSWHRSTGRGAGRERYARFGYRAVLLFLLALFLLDSARSLHNLYFDATYARADYRAIARHIEHNARPGDAIILNAPNQWEVFTYYHPDDRDVYPLARQRPLDIAVSRSELEQIVADHERLYGVFWGDAESDPERLIESWLEQNTYKAGETWYRDVRLAVYAVPAAVSDAVPVPVDAGFGTSAFASHPVIHLDAYTLFNMTLAPGDILQLALFWRTDAAIPIRYKVFVHLYDDEGELVAQTDREPGATLKPTNTWLPGERITDRYGVLLPAELPTGTYSLAVGLYDLSDPDARLQVLRDGTVADHRLFLAEIVVSDAEETPVGSDSD